MFFSTCCNNQIMYKSCELYYCATISPFHCSYLHTGFQPYCRFSKPPCHSVRINSLLSGKHLTNKPLKVFFARWGTSYILKIKVFTFLLAVRIQIALRSMYIKHYPKKQK